MLLRLSPMAAAPLSLPRLTRRLSSISHLSSSLVLFLSSSSMHRLTPKPYISKPRPRRSLKTLASSAAKGQSWPYTVSPNSLNSSDYLLLWQLKFQSLLLSRSLERWRRRRREIRRHCRWRRACRLWGRLGVGTPWGEDSASYSQPRSHCVAGKSLFLDPVVQFQIIYISTEYNCMVILFFDFISWYIQPCNPAVGGPAKSQLVHEVDALGGEIGKMADRYNT